MSTIAHDGDGNRVAKTANGVSTQYLVDDLNPTGYPQVVEELVNGAPQREYTYGLQRIDEDQVIQGAWVPSFYGYDGFGTVRQLTNSAGAVTDTWEYDAFGNVITSTGTTPNEFLYRGEQYDSDLGLYYLRARYYNPLTGRFMSRDPEDGCTTNPATQNKYVYADADPVDQMDPTGRASQEGVRGGGDLAEYALLVGAIALTTRPAQQALGEAVRCVFNTLNSAFEGLLDGEVFEYYSFATLPSLLQDGSLDLYSALSHCGLQKRKHDHWAPCNR